MTTRTLDLRAQYSTAELAGRILLCATAVVCCYQFQWMWLRAATCYWNLVADGWLGVHLVRTGPYTVLWGGNAYRYDIACTMADVWCGALAFLWSNRRSVVRNLAYWIAFGAGLFVFNIARLTFSDLLFAARLPWDLAHNIVAGIAYFIVWQWLWRTRPEPPMKTTGPSLPQTASSD